ncbi:MAG TPA: DUF3108 domain-containing protein [Thiolapillus brandeum]|uniref:DUF3108 domain-containing protein n=1 Tax=Thiolapillus brandeum TaxID=1076588 RepID=A0A831K2A4_9GAMM|nr:DUF3108 domain-containing protein [Thiolapillus brandeum]
MFPCAALALEPFSASYQLLLDNDKKGETQFNLLLTNNGYSFEAFTLPQGKLSKIDSKHEILETSHGHFNLGKPKPDTYYYAVRNASGTTMLEFFFNWKQKQLTLRGDKNQQKFALETGTQDRLSYILQAMALADSPLHTAYFKRVFLDGTENIILQKKLQKYISTPAGRFLALEIHIETSDGKDPRSLWLAVKQNFMPLLLVKNTRQGAVRMELTKIDKP